MGRAEPGMPIDYWIAKARILDHRSDNQLRGAVHHRVHARTLLNGRVRDLHLAINVQSRSTAGSEGHLLFCLDEDFRHPITSHLKTHFAAQAAGFEGSLASREARWFLQQHALAMRPDPMDRKVRLDYLRSDLFDPRCMQVLPPSGPLRNDDLQDQLRRFLRMACQDPQAWAYVFGELWRPLPGDPQAARPFHFDRLPGYRYGMHDIHMNQGNEPRYAHADGVYQDGGLLFELGHQGRWVGIFLAFQGQAWQTDDLSGHRLL